MKTYSVTTNEELRELCIQHNWFTCGTNEQYEKLFRSNENDISIDGIALIIWICSKEKITIGEILSELKKAREDFWNAYFGVYLSGNPYRFLRFKNVNGDIYCGNFSQFLSLLCNQENDKWTSDTLILIEENEGNRNITLWKRVYAEWVPYMKAYRLYDPKAPYNTISYEKDLESAEANHPEYRISEVDSDTMHVELQ